MGIMEYEQDYNQSLRLEHDQEYSSEELHDETEHLGGDMEGASPRFSVASIPQHEISWCRLILISMGTVGVETAWNLEFALAIPFFQQELELSPMTAQGLWAFGPISGLVVAPLVGRISDNWRSKWGRRRPFLLAGLLLIVTWSSIFSNSKYLGERLGNDETGSRTIGQIIGIVTFGLNDFCINVVQFPQRTLCSDLVPRSQQTQAQAMQAIMQSIGVLVANSFLLCIKRPVSRAPLVFFLANVIVTSAITVTLCFAKEERSDIEANGTRTPQEGIVGAAKAILSKLPSLDRLMMRVLVIQWFSWMSYFCSLQLVTEWMGHVVFGGDPDKSHPRNDVYQDGVAFAGAAIMVRSIVQLGASFSLPILSRRFPIRFIWGSALAIGALTFFAMSSSLPIRYHWFGFALVALIGIPYATSNTYPFSIVGSLYPAPETKGVHMGILNLSITLPQLLDTTYTGHLTEAYDESAVIKLGSLYMAIASIACFALLPNSINNAIERKLEEESPFNQSNHADSPDLDSPSAYLARPPSPSSQPMAIERT